MSQASATIRHQRPCAATTRSGEPCGAPALHGGAFCFTHEPTRQAERQAARVKGGANKATAVRVESAPLPSYLRPILGAVVKAIADVRDGRMSPAQGSSIAALAGVAVRLVTASQFEERLSALETNQGGAQQ